MIRRNYVAAAIAAAGLAAAGALGAAEEPKKEPLPQASAGPSHGRHGGERMGAGHQREMHKRMEERHGTMREHRGPRGDSERSQKQEQHDKH